MIPQTYPIKIYSSNLEDILKASYIEKFDR